jgi:hypothetical protein
METPFGHLTYCSNIHPGEKWDDHFAALKATVPYIRQNLAPGNTFALGLRIANEASIELSKPERLAEFKAWLNEQNIFMPIINGFPYGGFHNTAVKDQVHTPDWTTTDRRDYTIRLFDILTQLLPDNLDGGVSTPPLSYRLWWKGETDRNEATNIATAHILEVLDHLIEIKNTTGKLLHLDIEPEPDGILDNVADFVSWYRDVLLPKGTEYLIGKYKISQEKAKETILEHIQLCYDICHAAVAYEEPETILESLNQIGIKTGRIQVSSALKVKFDSNSKEKFEAIKVFDEPVYLHQVVTKSPDGSKIAYPDLPEALAAWEETNSSEWRVHFHVPLFIDNYGVLESTQNEIIKTLAFQIAQPFSNYMEVETYTWGVLPEAIQKPIGESIVREIRWVQDLLNNSTQQ